VDLYILYIYRPIWHILTSEYAVHMGKCIKLFRIDLVRLNICASVFGYRADRNQALSLGSSLGYVRVRVSFVDSVTAETKTVSVDLCYSD
jgi:hypothetical protein